MYNLLQKKIQDFLTTPNTCSTRAENDVILQFVHNIQYNSKRTPFLMSRTDIYLLEIFIEEQLFYIRL